jgi:hypothetical protein
VSVARVGLRTVDSVRAVATFDSGVLGRTAVIGAASGALVAAVVVPALVLIDGLSRGQVEWAELARGVLVGLVYLALVGAFVGTAAGTVAGLMLLAVGPVVTRFPRAAQRVVAAAGCAMPFAVPILIIGLGRDRWLASGWDDLANLVTVIAALLGLWKGPYIFAGRPVVVPEMGVRSGSAAG